MMRSIILAGTLALAFGTPARANPAVLAGAVLVAEQVLPPLSSAVGIVIDIPKLWTTLQGLVDARALALPPQPAAMIVPVPLAVEGESRIVPVPLAREGDSRLSYDGLTGNANPSLGGR